MSDDFYKRRSGFYYAFLLSLYDGDKDKLQEAFNEFSKKNKDKDKDSDKNKK